MELRGFSFKTAALAAALLSSGLNAVAAPATAPKAPEGKAIRVLVVANQESVLAAQMTGRIEQIDAALGSTIRAGQVLLRFNCEAQQAQLKMANAEYYGAQRTFESKAKLQAMQSVSELEVQQAAAAAQRAKAQIELIQVQIKQCSVRAPFSGRVTKLHAKRYESVNVSQALLEVVDNGKLKVKLNVPSNWLVWLKPGAAFSINIDETGQSYAGRVVRMNGRVDTVSQSIEIEGEVVGKPVQLLPGMSGVARFAQATKP
ncbi:efflux RND transporter periplasmic adaptor subunit [Massilia glaciei]|uniref:Efflux RND transporter periplasmic adaptor subunit n=1 Tax=Massilia glaciei TaxID=1524097 RepID=A0A2U2I6Z0_9BURK|nr:efflux RND transporter periplasmic adaptor subunit [Massilia glaciei]